MRVLMTMYCKDLLHFIGSNVNPQQRNYFTNVVEGISLIINTVQRPIRKKFQSCVLLYK